MYRDSLVCKVNAVGLEGECNFKIGVADKLKSSKITLLEGGT
jgi:hypothetical protein